MNRAGEFEWIARYLAPLSGEKSFALKDDAALLEVPDGKELVITQDAIMENIHFLSSDPLDTVAQKALRVNISDIVAKGATPLSYSMALGVPDKWQDWDMALFCQGLAKDQEVYDINLTGGDTYRSPESLCVSITMLGSVIEGGYVSRLGAGEGDLVVVSGTFGDSAIGLHVATKALETDQEAAAFFIDNYRIPKPPIALAPLIKQFATASMDISDGLLGDAAKLCKASGVAMEIDRSLIPLSNPSHKLIQKNEKFWSSVLAGGDDYQCLCTVKPDDWANFQSAAQECGVELTEIGAIIDSKTGNVSLHDKGVPLLEPIESFVHF